MLLIMIRVRLFVTKTDDNTWTDRQTDRDNAYITAHRGAVASLVWMTPGAATEGVTPLFFPEKLTTFLLISVTFY